MLKRLRIALVVGLLVAGCGVAPHNQPDVTTPAQSFLSPSDFVDKALAPAAEDQFKVLDQDPSLEALKALAARLNITINLNQTVIVNNGSTTTTQIVESNAAQCTHVAQDHSFDQPACSIRHVTASSVLNDYFRLDYLTDNNLHSAWAPAATDENPTLTFDLNGCNNLSALALKMSPQGVVVDVAVSVNGSDWQTIVTGLVPHYRQLDWINLPATAADRVRLTFRGMQDGKLLVCNVSLCGTPCAAPSTLPSVMPSAIASPSPSPSMMPSASPSASMSPSASPSASPSVMPSESPSPVPTASPSVAPSASPSASVMPSASPSASASPSPTPTPTPAVSTAPSPTPTPSGTPMAPAT